MTLKLRAHLQFFGLDEEDELNHKKTTLERLSFSLEKSKSFHELRMKPNCLPSVY